MKRFLVIAAAVLVFAAAGWAVLWFTGRGQIEARLDQEVARLNAQGFEIAHGERRIGGFPYGYEVTYDDVSITDPVGGIRYELPSLTGVATADNPDRVAFHFPPEFSVAVQFNEAMREQYEELPEELAVDVEADDFVVETTGPQGSAIEFETRADSLLIVSAGEAAPVGLAIEVIGMEGALTLPRDPELGTVSARTQVEQLDYALSFVDPEGTRTTTEGVGEAISVSGSSNLRTPEQWESLFTGEGSGEAEFAYQAGQLVSRINVQDSPDGLDGTITQRAGAAGGVVRVGDGRIEVRGSSENNRYEIESEAEAFPLTGEARLGSIEVVYVAPVAPSEEMSDFTMRLAMSGIEIDDSLWDAVDPGKTLGREEAHVLLEVAGTGRMLQPAGEGSTDGPPIEVGRLEIVVADVAALGASATAEGSLEFTQPANQPQGTVVVRLQNVLELAGKLAELGVLDAGSYQAATLMSAIYTRPGDLEGELITEIDFSPDQITINDLPVR